jgi:hypothetical protein
LASSDPVACSINIRCFTVSLGVKIVCLAQALKELKPSAWHCGRFPQVNVLDHPQAVSLYKIHVIEISYHGSIVVLILLIRVIITVIVKKIFTF